MNLTLNLDFLGLVILLLVSTKAWEDGMMGVEGEGACEAVCSLVLSTSNGVTASEKRIERYH